MISPAITVHDEFIIIYKGDYFIFLKNDNALSLYCLLKRVPNLLDDIPFEQARDFCPLPHLPPKDYCIHSFWSQNTEKRNTTISQMRLRSVFKMRISILNTATTEQMGYDIVSFFRLFSPNKSDEISSEQAVVF